jgi:hypothetical protein
VGATAVALVRLVVAVCGLFPVRLGRADLSGLNRPGVSGDSMAAFVAGLVFGNSAGRGGATEVFYVEQTAGRSRC